jgi:signal peptidase I
MMILKAKSHEQENQKAQTAKKGINKLIYLLYIVLVLCIIGYVLSGIVLLGLAAFILIIAVIAIEFRLSVKSEGGMKTLTDIIVAVVAAVLIFWLIPAAVLQTGSPINVVASCSMLPVLHRGDVVVLHGISNMSSFLALHKIPVANVSQGEFNNMINNMQNEFIEPFAYFNNSKSDISPVIDTVSYSGIGFYNLACLAQEPTARYNQCYVSNASQQASLIKYNSSIAKVVAPQANGSIVYVPSIVIGNIPIAENYSNPIIVYKTTKDDYFTGDIIHRVFAAMKVGDNYYLLTKGDNNAILDIESLNYPINSSDVLGYVIADVPYLGFPSLIIKGQIGNVPGCNQTIVRNSI